MKVLSQYFQKSKIMDSALIACFFMQITIEALKSKPLKKSVFTIGKIKPVIQK